MLLPFRIPLKTVTLRFKIQALDGGLVAATTLPNELRAITAQTGIVTGEAWRLACLGLSGHRLHSAHS